MRFIDSNIFLHAWLKPRRELSDKELEVKENSKKILKRVEEGEEVATSVVHVAEIANILEARLGVEKTLEFIEALLGTETIRILDVEGYDILLAVEEVKKYKIGLVDAIAIILMKKHNINEIYTQDKDFYRTPVKVINV